MEYKAFTNLEVESDWYQSMCSLHSTIFKLKSPDSIKEELYVRPIFLVLIALDNEHVVGYKIGYQDRRTRFYSWLGGVNSEYRGQGIASELMRRQHVWCESQGYDVVRTQTKNKWRSMLILNLRHGFDVVGTYTDEKGEPKIILEKRL
ncbi:hypothetical protein MM817_02712 [Acidibacillus sp. S0AB]|uniref:N-acetyltransferase domain-containing protein n=2 Tax=Sulfoacidibacillus ferrooxidans TaxID=2005001 RepID=A0A9X1VBT1_9BACL|nr:hypothetical protein [Sulfoacidibacillus ferrooxidans]